MLSLDDDWTTERDAEVGLAALHDAFFDDFDTIGVLHHNLPPFQRFIYALSLSSVDVFIVTCDRYKDHAAIGKFILSDSGMVIMQGVCYAIFIAVLQLAKTTELLSI